MVALAGFGELDGVPRQGKRTECRVIDAHAHIAGLDLRVRLGVDDETLRRLRENGVFGS